MRYILTFPQKKFIFQETSSGFLELTDIVREKDDLLKNNEIIFRFDEIDSWAAIELIGEPNAPELLSLNYRFLIKSAKIISYIDKGVLYKAGTWLNYDFVTEKPYLSLFKTLVEEEILWNIFFEFVFGSFKDPSIEELNITYLIGGVPDNIQKTAKDWYSSQHNFFTKVVGFRYRKERFVVKNSDDLKIKPEDPVFVVREHDNQHDPNAISVIFANGEKLGYIRRTISHFLAPIMDKGIFYSGKIKAILNDFRDEDERIYLELRRKVL